jgi:hypothetical protein
MMMAGALIAFSRCTHVKRPACSVIDSLSERAGPSFLRLIRYFGSSLRGQPDCPLAIPFMKRASLEQKWTLGVRVLRLERMSSR